MLRFLKYLIIFPISWVSIFSGNAQESSVKSIYEIYESKDNPIEEIVQDANLLFAEKRYREAIDKLKKASTFNHPEALLSLGILYEKGLINGTDTIIYKNKKNDEEGFFYIQRSARLGFKPAQKELSRLYQLGIGTPRDSDEANRRTKIFQKPYNSTIYEDNVFEIVELNAEFPGGNVALQRFLYQNVRYPASAQEKEIQGKVVVKFVGKDGLIRDTTILKGIDEDLDKEALRVVNKNAPMASRYEQWDSCEFLFCTSNIF